MVFRQLFTWPPLTSECKAARMQVACVCADGVKLASAWASCARMRTHPRDILHQRIADSYPPKVV